jgi:glycosyltransferase involved in cell wall biosynthesis
MHAAFPDAPVHTSLYEPSATFPAFADLPVATFPLNRIPQFRRNHRVALPVLAPAFSRHRVDADVVLCSSSGWAHGVTTYAPKVVYCYTPARWLYDGDRYLGDVSGLARPVLTALRPSLIRWDRRAASTACRYLTLSQVVRDRIQTRYGIDAEVIPPPHTIRPDAPSLAVEGIDPGFLLCVSRLLPYKNVAPLIEAFRGLPDLRLVLVGDGPERQRLAPGAPSNVFLLGVTSDEELRWLYGTCLGVVAPAHEDYGLTPLEGAAFGKPAAVLRWGGYLDTVVEDHTGLFFDAPTPAGIAPAVARLATASWDGNVIRMHAQRFSEDRFIARLQEVLGEVAAG